MKLDRNLDTNYGLGKYALIKARAVSSVTADQLKRRQGKEGTFVEIEGEAIDLGSGPSGSFFVIRHKDTFAEPAFREYAKAVRSEASEIRTTIQMLGDTEPARVEALTAQAESLEEYAQEIDREADIARDLAARGKASIPT